MAVEKYIDYIDDPNDTYEEYLEKAKNIISDVYFSRKKNRKHMAGDWKY